MTTTKKNVSVKVIDSNKVNDLKKEITLEQRKNEVKNDLKTSKVDLSILDTLNLNLSIDELKKDIAIKNKGTYLLRSCNDANKDEHKKLRGNARNKSLLLIRNLLILKVEKKNLELIKSVKEFIKYYIETYSLNDFSTKSFYNGNMEQKNKKTFQDFIDLHKFLVTNNLL